MRPEIKGPLFRRQFLLSDAPSDAAPDHFVHRQISEGHLYHSLDLPVADLTDADGRPWVMLGEALPGPQGSLGGAELLRKVRTRQVEDVYRQWDGRWLLIGDGALHTDLRGSIPAFYTPHCVASTPGLLRLGELPRHRLSKTERCDWFPAPGSGFDEVSRVLPSQVLRLHGGGCTPRRLPRAAKLSETDSITRMRSLLRSTVESLDSDRLVVPLTAGWDSRLILASCVDAGVEALCVTLTYPHISQADRELPPLLARSVGYEYQQVRPVPRGRTRRELGDLYDRHVGGHVREWDRRFLQRGQYDWVRTGDVLLRGLSLDVLRLRHHVWPPAGMTDADSLVRWLQPAEIQEKGMRRYLDWVGNDSQSYPFDERYSLEQGESAWASMSEVALDLTGGRSLNPGNSWAFAEAALALPREFRATSGHHRLIIDQIAPQLLDHPVNPPESKWRPRRIAAALQRRMVRLSHVGRGR